MKSMRIVSPFAINYNIYQKLCYYVFGMLLGYLTCGLYYLCRCVSNRIARVLCNSFVIYINIPITIRHRTGYITAYAHTFSIVQWHPRER